MIFFTPIDRIFSLSDAHSTPQYLKQPDDTNLKFRKNLIMNSYANFQ